MRYALLLYYPELGVTGQLDEAAMAEGQRAFAEFAEAATAAGVLVAAEVLQPSATTTTLRPGEDGLTVHEGPRSEASEQLGGAIVIEVPDRDAAIAWAERAPSAHWGPIEIRPSATHVEGGRWV